MMCILRALVPGWLCAALLAAAAVPALAVPAGAESPASLDCGARVSQLRGLVAVAIPPVPAEDQARIDKEAAAAGAACDAAQAAEPDNPSLLLRRAHLAYIAGDTSRWFELIHRSAEADYPPAMVALARILDKGEKDVARELLLRAVEIDDKTARRKLVALSRSLEDGDRAAAQALLLRVAAMDNEAARIQAALEFMPGRIGPEDPARVAALFGAMIDGGSSRAAVIYAMRVLGLARGDGTPAAMAEGLDLLRRATETHGDAGAMIYLSLFHLQGRVVARDVAAAKRYARMAIAAGSARAYGTMGQIFQNTGDLEAAVEWFRKGAERDDGFSQAMLGFMYSGGFGVDMDIEEAGRWWHRSRWNGNRLGAGYLRVYREQMAERERALREQQEQEAGQQPKPSN